MNGSMRHPMGEVDQRLAVLVWIEKDGFNLHARLRDYRRNPMIMNNEKSFESAAHVIGQALRTVERQKHALSALLTADEKQQRAALFHFLDRCAPDLFLMVCQTAEGRERRVRVADLPALAERLPVIFRGKGGKDFDPDMFNDWLYSKDLSHHFHGDGIYLRW